jgi:hypothetical protein
MIPRPALPERELFEVWIFGVPRSRSPLKVFDVWRRIRLIARKAPQLNSRTAEQLNS